VCTTPSASHFAYLADVDESDPQHGVVCVKVTELNDIAKAGYWLWKAYKWIREVEPVPIP
jgi:hypothetical protein